jgi:hypothetical protein
MVFLSGARAGVVGMHSRSSGRPPRTLPASGNNPRHVQRSAAAPTPSPTSPGSSDSTIAAGPSAKSTVRCATCRAAA